MHVQSRHRDPLRVSGEERERKRVTYLDIEVYRERPDRETKRHIPRVTRGVERVLRCAPLAATCVFYASMEKRERSIS